MKRKIFYDTIDRTQQGIGSNRASENHPKKFLMLDLKANYDRKIKGGY